MPNTQYPLRLRVKTNMPFYGIKVGDVLPGKRMPDADEYAWQVNAPRPNAGKRITLFGQPIVLSSHVAVLLHKDEAEPI